MIDVGANVKVTPIDGWGYFDRIDGNLAPPFFVEIHAAGIHFAINVRGWRGKVVSPSSKYRDMGVEMTPRHVDWDGVVVLTVRDGETTVFSGMATTTGLDCTFQ